jgi:hypothetical protein
MSPTEPIGNRRHFQKISGGYGYTLIDEAVRVEVRQLRRERHQLIGEMDVLCEWAGAHTHNGAGSLSCADLNLSSQAARTARAKYCAERAKSKPGDFDWVGAIDDTCRLVIDAERNHIEGGILDDAVPHDPSQDFRVHGLSIPSDGHSQLVTDGGGLKSLILLLVLGEMARADIPVAYLDWEWNAARHKARKLRLFGPERLDRLHYIRCYNPLTVERDAILRYCDHHQIKFLAIDSIAAACDGKLADDDVARAYFHVLHGGFPPSLAAAHVSKGAIDRDAEQKAFGSGFFHNFARMTWTVRKQIQSKQIVSVMLTPFKQNDGDQEDPIGLEFEFSAIRIFVRNVDPIEVSGLAENIKLHIRMGHALKQGPKTYAELAAELGCKVNSVTQAAGRHTKLFTKVPNPDGIVRLALVTNRRE